MALKFWRMTFDASVFIVITFCSAPTVMLTLVDVSLVTLTA